jgi:ubiquitin-activating enzyme E1
MENAPAPELDLNLYSRQIGTFGVEAMGKLIQLKVLIQGMGGVREPYF